MNKLITWVKNKLGITVLEERLNRHHYFVTDKMAELKAYTRVDADVGMRGNNTIILTGVYRNKAYVQFFDMGDGEFERLVHQLREMRGHALIRHIDAPLSYKGVFDV